MSKELNAELSVDDLNFNSCVSLKILFMGMSNSYWTRCKFIEQFVSKLLTLQKCKKEELRHYVK